MVTQINLGGKVIMIGSISWELGLLIIIAVILLGIFIFMVAYLLPLIKQVKKTAQQVETTAFNLNQVINTDFKSWLNRGEKVLAGWEEKIQPLIIEKAQHLPSSTAKLFFSEIENRFFRNLSFWAIKEAWKKLREKRKVKTS
ncbi:MAG: hypothetical protein N3A64_04840 [Desulfobacterota bacterium]|nr:hypothetical protein [Thermodesulfobacteriota bacterium]